MVSRNRLTTIEDMLKHAIQLNRLLIPIQSIEGVLCNYTHPLVVWNNDKTFPVSLIGSAICVYYRNKYLLLCTRHQLKLLDGRSYEDVGLLDKDGGYFCSATGISHFLEPLNEVDLHDLVVFNFTKPCQARSHMKQLFFNLESVIPDTASEQIVGFFASEYPSKELDYGLAEEPKRLALRRAQVFCELAPYSEQPKEDSTLLRLTPRDPLSFNPNGMSGGSAFAIQFVNGAPHAYLAGMIVRAGTNSVYILKSGSMISFINSWL